MHHDYACIRRRIPVEPKWWDENGVPRYDDFTPQSSANIYAEEAVLLLIECQSCERSFNVGMTTDMHARALGRPMLSDLVKGNEIHFGDPPNVECCAAGPSMNSVPRRVLEFWRRVRFEWERIPALEVDIEPDWMRDSTPPSAGDDQKGPQS